MFSFSLQAMAQSQTQTYCVWDYFKFCGQYSLGSKEVISCMRETGVKLSKDCIKALMADGYVTKLDVVERAKEQGYAVIDTSDGFEFRKIPEIKEVKKIPELKETKPEGYDTTPGGMVKIVKKQRRKTLESADVVYIPKKKTKTVTVKETIPKKKTVAIVVSKRKKKPSKVVSYTQKKKVVYNKPQKKGKTWVAYMDERFSGGQNLEGYGANFGRR